MNGDKNQKRRLLRETRISVQSNWRNFLRAISKNNKIRHKTQESLTSATLKSDNNYYVVIFSYKPIEKEYTDMHRKAEEETRNKEQNQILHENEMQLWHNDFVKCFPPGAIVALGLKRE